MLCDTKTLLQKQKINKDLNIYICRDCKTAIKRYDLIKRQKWG